MLQTGRESSTTRREEKFEPVYPDPKARGRTLKTETCAA